MSGYAQQQLISLNSYERLLIELGEKSYTPMGSGYSVEVRLAALLFFNTALFIASKVLMKKSGFNILSMTNQQNGASKPLKKRKMRGPKINLDDIPEVS